MTREQAIAKIQKCLRLSKSANEHEAAAALRQALKLMAAFGVDDKDLLAAGVASESVKSKASSRPAQWEASLANLCARAFGCEIYFEPSFPPYPGHYVFVGIDSRQLLCGYAYTVLVRQCRRARANYIATKLRRCGPRQRTARADEFCIGWIAAVRSTVEDFAREESDRHAVQVWMAARGLQLTRKDLARREIRGDHGDGFAGMRAADGVRLDRPITGQQREALTA